MACSYNQHQSVLLYYVNHVDIPPVGATLSSASPQAVSRCALLKSNMSLTVYGKILYYSLNSSRNTFYEGFSFPVSKCLFTM